MKKIKLSAVLGILLATSIGGVISADASEMFSLGETIEETVLVDEKDVKITATDLVYDADSATVNLLIENNSDKNLSFLSGALGYDVNSVNGYMGVGGWVSTDVQAGKKAMEEATFRSSELLLYGIKDIANFELGFEIEEVDTYEDYLKTGPIKVETSISDTYDCTVNTYHSAISEGTYLSNYGISLEYYDEEKVYELNGVSIDSKAFLKNSDGEHAAMIEVFNQSDKIVHIAYGDFILNGLKIYSGEWTSDTVNPNCRIATNVVFDSCIEDSFWEKLSITDISDIQMTFTLKDEDYNTVDSTDFTFSVKDTPGTFDGEGEEVYNSNNISVVSKGVVDSGNEYDKGLYMLFIVKNNNSTDISVDTAYESLSINGFMTSFSDGDAKIKSGGSALMVINMSEYNLEDVNISSADEIKDVEFTLEIEDFDYNEIDAPVISVNYSK